MPVQNGRRKRTFSDLRRHKRFCSDLRLIARHVKRVAPPAGHTSARNRGRAGHVPDSRKSPRCRSPSERSSRPKLEAHVRARSDGARVIPVSKPLLLGLLHRGFGRVHLARLGNERFDFCIRLPPVPALKGCSGEMAMKRRTSQGIRASGVTDDIGPPSIAYVQRALRYPATYRSSSPASAAPWRASHPVYQAPPTALRKNR